MELQKCQNCGVKFYYRAIQKNFFSGEEKRLKCENCGTEHRLRKNPGRFLSLLVLLPMFLWSFLMLLEYYFDRVLMFFITIAYIIAIILLSPYLVKYDKIEKNN